MTGFQFALTGQWSRGVSTACGGIALFVGVLVLAGWLFQVPTLKSILPGLVSMKPNAALAFVLAGAALALLAVSPRRARAGQWLALFVVLIGGVTLGEYLLGWHVGIDELLFTDDPNAIATTVPGRMAPSTAACFVLLGLALVGIGWESRRGFRPAELLALVAAVVSVSSLVEYAVGQPIFFGFSQYTRMALHTAAGFAVLATGVLLARPDRGVVGGLRSGRVSLLEGSVYAAMGLVLLGVLAGGGWFYRAQEQQARRDVEANLEAIARLKADQIVQWRAERLGDAAVLMGSHFFAEGVARWLANPQAEDRDRILAWFRRMRAYNKYDDVLLADGRGQVRLSASDRPPAFHAELVEALATASRTRQPVLTDLHRPPGDPTPHFDIIAPLLAGNETTSEPIGAVILRQEARQFLYPLIQSWPTASLSAETLLVRRDGDAALFLNELRHRRDTAFTLRIPLTRQDVPAVMAVSARESVSRGVDYRGVTVLTVLKHIPDTSWFMVVKVDEAEALTEWRFRASLIVAVILALALALAAAARTIGAQREKQRVLSQSVELLRKANRAYRVLSECNQALVRADDELQLLHAVCQIVVDHGGYRLAWVGFAEEDEARSLRPVAQAGVEAGYLEGLQLTWADTERGRGPTGTAIRTGKSNVAQDILHDERFAPWRAEALRRGYAASVALPLTGQGRTFGVLGVYAAEPNAFDEQELKLLEELAGDLAFGIAALRLREDAAKGVEESAQARQDLHRSHELLDQTGRLAKVGGWQLDVDTQILRWTMETYRIHEADPNLQPSVADGIQFYAPQARPVIAAAVQAAIDAGTPFDLELPFVTAKGTRIWVRAQGIAERREGRTIRVYGAFQDITDRKQAEDEIRTLNAELEQRVEERTRELAEANKELESFSYSVSHDLRAPLRHVQGYVEMLHRATEGQLSVEAQRYLNTITEASVEMGQLIDDLLAFSRTGRTEMTESRVDLDAIVHAAIRNEERATKDRHIVWQVAPLPPVIGDASLLKLAVSNLVGNAVKYSRQRDPARIEIGCAGEEGGRVVLFVRDNGAGFDMHYVHKLFGVFQRLHRAEEFEGTGIGLATVRRIVARHGGRVWAEGVVNEGATFYVTLKRSPSA